MAYRYGLVFIVWLVFPLLPFFTTLEFSNWGYRILFALFATGLFWLIQPAKKHDR